MISDLNLELNTKNLTYRFIPQVTYSNAFITLKCKLERLTRCLTSTTTN